MTREQETERRQRELSAKRRALEAQIEALRAEFEASETEAMRIIGQEQTQERQLGQEKREMGMSRQADRPLSQGGAS